MLFFLNVMHRIILYKNIKGGKTAICLVEPSILMRLPCFSSEWYSYKGKSAGMKKNRITTIAVVSEVFPDFVVGHYE
jgi:hypothetical protein